MYIPYFINHRLFWLRDFLKGSPIWRSYRTVRRIAKAPVKYEKERQAMLADILSYAKNNTGFYSAVHGDTLADFPVINKHVISSNYDAFLVPADRIPGHKGPVLRHETSGSTGTPFRAYQDLASYYRRLASTRNTYLSLGYHMRTPHLLIRSCETPPPNGRYLTYNSGLNQWRLYITSFSDESFEQIVDLIKEKKIGIVRAYFSILEYFSEYLVRKGIALPSSFLFISVGEKLSESVRSRIVDMLHVHVFSNYSNEENGVFGSSALDGSGELIRLNGANCIIELLGLDNDEPVPVGHPGRVVVTDLTNKAMPMIRYDIGDLAFCHEAMPSGEPLVIQLLECRKEDMVYDTSGMPVPMVFPYEIWDITGLRQVQFIQEDVKGYVLMLNVAGGNDSLDVSALESIMRGIMGADATVEVRFLDDIPVMSSGKRKVVIQKCAKYLKSK